MGSFFRSFFASFFAIAIFFVLVVLALVGLYKLASSEEKPVVKANTVLVLDVSRALMEQPLDNGPAFASVFGEEVDGLYHLVQAIDAARTDSLIKGIYLVGTYNPNGFATSTELRQALIRFRDAGKFVVAYANYLDQRAYDIMSVANELYLNPAGSLDWQGYSMQLAFFKNTLDKLEVKPEIFYAGQFKSATEPFRLTRMSDANRQQMGVFLEGLYQLFQADVSEARGVDTAQLRQMAANLRVRSSHDAVRLKLADGVKYDDEVRALIAKRTGAASIDKINFMNVADYYQAAVSPAKSKDQVAVIYAQGEIVDGRGQEGEIGGETYRKLIRKVRLDKKVKAVVLRVNSPGGSAVASEVIHRELSLLQKEKPLVVSMGDYAASGGYYISCLADSIFAQPSSLTGSIGVF
ncbi:MAG: signal peptide peptidase SppA, partial [Chitinophagaceae bacterium]|nr:signal peptide peptidase SppA [Chitinophagaceae bacterium]